MRFNPPLSDEGVPIPFFGSAPKASVELDYGVVRVRVRVRARVRFSDLYHSPKVASVAVHKEQPVLAIGSRRQLLKLYPLGTKKRITIKAHSDFWGSRLGPISALCFHPTQQLLATGAANDHLSVFSYEASSWTTVM